MGTGADGIIILGPMTPNGQQVHKVKDIDEASEVIGKTSAEMGRDATTESDIGKSVRKGNKGVKAYCEKCEKVLSNVDLSSDPRCPDCGTTLIKASSLSELKQKLIKKDKQMKLLGTMSSAVQAISGSTGNVRKERLLKARKAVVDLAYELGNKELASAIEVIDPGDSLERELKRARKELGKVVLKKE